MIVVACAAMLVGFLGFFVYNIVTIEDWRIAEIDKGVEGNDGSILSVAMLDSTGSPHIAYTARDGIGHAWFDGREWATDVHSIELSDWGVSCCAAIGTDDTVHAFVSIANSYVNLTDFTRLIHLIHADGSWTEEKIQGLPEFERYTTRACALGPGDDIHVLSVGENFTLSADIEHDLHAVHWYFDGNDWNVTRALPISGEWHYFDSNRVWITDMAIDVEEGIHAVAHGMDADEAVYISRIDGEWDYEVLSVECFGLPRIALDGSKPVIAAKGSESVVIVAKEGVEWKELAYIDDAPFYGTYDIAVADDGTLHFACRIGDGHGTWFVQHRAFENGSVVTRTVHDSIEYDSVPSCEIDNEGRAHIGFADYSGTVTYATDAPDEDALSNAAVDAVSKALLVLGVLAAAALMVLGVLALRKLRRWWIDRFNEEPDEIRAKRLK